MRGGEENGAFCPDVNVRGAVLRHAASTDVICLAKLISVCVVLVLYTSLKVFEILRLGWP